MTIGAAKPTRPATSLLAVNVLHRVIYQANCASWACHRHRRHPVETDRPRKTSAALSCQSDTNSTSQSYIGLPGGTSSHFPAPRSNPPPPLVHAVADPPVQPAPE